MHASACCYTQDALGSVALAGVEHRWVLQAFQQAGQAQRGGGRAAACCASQLKHHLRGMALGIVPCKVK